MEWPKYYKDYLITPNESGNIGIITGWTKKEEVNSLLNEKSLKKVSVIGQLYSKEGVNYIIRNIFLNPKINTLIITGKDLSGSIEYIKNFITAGDDQDLLHKEIPQESIKKFREWFKNNTHFVKTEELDSYIENLEIKEENWLPESIEFPEPEVNETIDFPSEETCIRLEDKKIADLWLKVLDRIIKFGANKMSQYSEMQREIVNMTTIINDEDPDDPYLPDFLYFNEKDLNDYYPQLMTDRIFDGVEYTYGSRLRNFEGINQIEAIIEDLKANHYSRRALAVTWNVPKDYNNPKSPCLDLVHALVQRNKLYLTCYMRSNDMYRAWPQNTFAFRKIQKEIADQIGFPIGKLIVISNSAHIYERDYLAAAETVEKYKPQTECLSDPRGNFQIETDDNEITVNHYAPEGQKIQVFKGQTATEISNKLFTFVSDNLHALDLGKELAKAEIALKYNLKFNQDNDLDVNSLIGKKKGKFIVIDGTDGSGKGTQTNLLVEKFKNKGYQVEMADFPQYGQKSASLVEEYLNGKFGNAKEVGPYRASIFYACDRYAASEQIKNWLNQGKIVISNRYVSANMGHQTGKIKDQAERDKFLEWLHELEYDIFGIPKPDINILLYMPPEVGQELVDKKGNRDYVNGAKRDIHEADIEHLRDAANAYKYVAEKYDWLTIDCAPNNQLKKIEEIHDILWQKLNGII